MTAEHIATHLPTDLKWAVAGRSESKLQAVVEECKRVNPDRVQPAIEVANVDSEEELTALSKRTFILITTVGPYCMYGEKVFKTCAENGTHYFDVTGEFPWVAKMIKKYEKTAQQSGALMFPQIGVESAPSDLCTWALAKFVREELGAKTKDVVISIHNLKGAPSGGTLATVLSIFDYFSLDEVQAAGKPYAASPIPHKGHGRPYRSLLTKIFGSQYIPDLGMLSTSVAAITDAATVERTWGLLSSTPSRKDEFYGPNFTWMQCFRVRNWLHGVVLHWGIMFGSFLLVMFPFVRTLVRKYVYQPGQGPTRQEMEREEVEYRGFAKPDDESMEKKKAFCTATFRGSMYYRKSASASSRCAFANHVDSYGHVSCSSLADSS